jgi:hypothetical protein
MPKKAAKKPTQKVNKIARQDALPGMDVGIKEIEDAALDYREGRDERMAATEVEVTRKQALIAVMHKHGKQSYLRRIGDKVLKVELKVEKESVKVALKDQAPAAGEGSETRSDQR